MQFIASREVCSIRIVKYLYLTCALVPSIRSLTLEMKRKVHNTPQFGGPHGIGIYVSPYLFFTIWAPPLRAAHRFDRSPSTPKER